MAYVPPHKRVSGNSTRTPTPSSLNSLSVSSPASRHHRNPRRSDKIVYAAGCVFRWSPFPPFSSSGSDEDESLRLEPFPCDPIERKTGAKPLVLVPSSRDASSPFGEVAAAAIVDRYLPELLAAAERARARAMMTQDVPKEKEEEEELKLGLVARIGKVIFHSGGSGSTVSLDFLREAAKAGEDGPSSRIRKTFYTYVTSECFDRMEQSAAKMMGLKFLASKQHYRVMVFDKHRSDSEISCKCVVQEDGKLANYKIERKEIREVVEDISCVSKDLDLWLMLSTKRTLKNLDAEAVDAIGTLISSAVIDPNVKGGLRWPFGKGSIGERFSVVGAWHTNYRAFRNETLRLKLRRVDRFDHLRSTGEVANEVCFKLLGVTKKLQDGDLEADTLKEMLENAVGVIWNSAFELQDDALKLCSCRQVRCT